MTETDGKLDRIEDGYILTSSQIIEVGKYSEDKGRAIIQKHGNHLHILGNETQNPSILDLKQINGAIIPGFVKGHGHDHESVLIGVARDVPLTTWLDEAVNIFTGLLHGDKEGSANPYFLQLLGKSPYFVAYRKARLDDVSFGITTAVTHHCNYNKYHVKELVEANEEAGTRLFIGVGSQDRNYDSRILDSVEEAIERLNRYEKEFGHLTRTIIIPGPDQLFSNGPELLIALKKWATDRNKIIHIHSSEEPATTAWFVEKYGMTPIQYADSIGFLDNKTLLAHQVNTTKEDLEILSSTGAMVVHNSLANTILGSGMPPIVEMLQKGIPVCFSTDGSGSADNQNMIAAARLASQYQKAYHKNATLLNSEEVLKRVTIHPANMLRVNAGILENGRNGDFIVFDLNKPQVIPTRTETVIENMIWASTGGEIKHVIADGKVLVENYKFKVVDFEEILLDIQKLALIFEKHKTSLKIRSETGVRSQDSSDS